MGLSVGKVTAQNAKYYTNAVAKGREDYYSGLGEAPPTRFSGRTDGGFDTPDIVPVDDVAEIFKRQGDDDHRKVMAFDLACSVPKSVSVLWAMSDDETRKIIENNLRKSAEAAVGSMQFYAREGHAGAQMIEVAAPENMFDFRHRTSRALQPQLHSHIIVENRVFVDGRWLALDGREVLAQAKNAGMVFDATLRRGLTEELGVAWEPTKASGASGDIRGVDKKLIAQWSVRRLEVEGKLDEWRANFERETGREPTPREARKAAQGFTLSTRQAKKGAHSDADLRERWQAEGRQFQPDPLAATQSAAREWAQNARGTREALQNRLVGGRAEVADPVAALLDAVDKSSEPTQNRWQLEVLARGVAPQRERETVAEWNSRVEGLCHQAVSSGDLVSVYRPALDAASSVRADGLPSEMSPRQERFATRAQIEKEWAVISALASGRPAPRLGEAVKQAAEREVATGGLSEEQGAAITKLAEADTIGAALIGAPGVGKTTALGVFAKTAHAQGWTVTGLASTGKAAGEVHTAVEQGGGQSSTITAWMGSKRYEAGVQTNTELVEKWRNETARVKTNELLLLDEGSITSTEHLEQISAYCQTTGAKLVIVGDHKQIGSVEQGGILLAIATAEGEAANQIGLSRIPTATIETVVRQNEEWERRAAENLRRGGKEAAKAVDAYAEHGRVHAMPDELAGRHEIASRMADDVIAGRESIAIGYTGNAVKELNAAIVQELVDREYLSQEKLPNFDFRVGQRVLTKKNIYEDKKMVVKNGEVWTVLGQEQDGDGGELVVANLKTGEKRGLEKGYVETVMSDGRRQVQGGYATTPITIQSASLNGSSYTLGSEYASPSSVLVPMTRGKEANHYYIPEGLGSGRDDPLIAVAGKRDPEAKAKAWLRAKAAAAPAENDKAAIQHVAQAQNLAKSIKEAERARTERAILEKAREKERKQSQDFSLEIG